MKNIQLITSGVDNSGKNMKGANSGDDSSEKKKTRPLFKVLSKIDEQYKDSTDESYHTAMEDAYFEHRIEKAKNDGRVYTGYSQPRQREILSKQGVTDSTHQDYYIKGDFPKDLRGQFSGEPKRKDFSKDK